VAPGFVAVGYVGLPEGLQQAGDVGGVVASISVHHDDEVVFGRVDAPQDGVSTSWVGADYDLRLREARDPFDAMDQGWEVGLV